MIELRTITVKAYRDEAGKPTCISNFKAGHICQWFRLRKFGTLELCGINDEKVIRDSGGIGYTRPTSSCPIWSK